MSANKVRSLVQSATPPHRVRPVELQRCDECRDEVPFTTLVVRHGDLVCGDCAATYAWLQECIFGGDL